MSHAKQGFGPRYPRFFPFDVKYDSGNAPDGRPTTGNGAKSPRVPVKIHSNSDPTSRKAGGRRNTNANRKNGGGGMYWSPLREGMAG